MVPPIFQSRSGVVVKTEDRTCAIRVAGRAVPARPVCLTDGREHEPLAAKSAPVEIHPPRAPR